MGVETRVFGGVGVYGVWARDGARKEERREGRGW